MNKKSVIIYKNWADMVCALSDELAGKLSKAIYQYSFEGIEPDDEIIKAMFLSMKDGINQNAEKYQAKKERMEKINEERKKRQNKVDTKSSRNRNEIENDIVRVTDTDTDTDTVTDTVNVTVLPKGNSNKSIRRFTPPTLDEVREYFKEKGIDDPNESEKFFDYYTSNGWYVGKTKMKDWKSAVRNWIKNIKAYRPKEQNVFDEWRNA